MKHYPQLSKALSAMADSVCARGLGYVRSIWFNTQNPETSTQGRLV
jgi:hypothetical protein